jgi:hypothetical protein
MEDKVCISILDKLYSINGKDKDAWKFLLTNMYDIPSYEKIIYFFEEKMKKDPSNTLTLDIIDFLVDYGPKDLIVQISSVNFMSNFCNLLKNIKDIESKIYKKGIFLTQKWYDKIKENPNESYPGFEYNYTELKKHNFNFPLKWSKLFTYQMFISESEAEEIKSKIDSEKNDIIPFDFNNLPLSKEIKVNNEDDNDNNKDNENLQFSEIIIREPDQNNKEVKKLRNILKNSNGINPFDELKKDLKFPDNIKHKFSNLIGKRIDMQYRSTIINSKVVFK